MSTPRPYYFKNGVVVFFVRDKQVYYNVLMWNDSGMKQFSVRSGKYNNDDLDLIVKGVQQSFGDVIRNE